MATGGDGSGVGVGMEFRRVCVTGIPTNSNKEWFVRNRLGNRLPGEILDINTQGTSSAIVTLRCEQGHSCRELTELDMGDGHFLYDLGTLHTTLTLGNVPREVSQEYEQLAEKHGVVFKGTDTAFTVQGDIDSVYNLRAEADARYLQQRSQLTPPCPEPMEGAGVAGGPTAANFGSHIGPPPGMSTHALSRSFSDPHSLGYNPPITTTSGSRFNPLAPLRPSALGAATGHPATSGHTGSFTTGGGLATSVRSPVPTPSCGPIPVPPTTTTAGHLPPDASSYGPSPPTTAGHLPPGPCDTPPFSPADHGNPTIHGREYDPLAETARDTDPSVAGDKAACSDTGHKSPSPPPLGRHGGKVLTGLNPDALALVKKLPEGDIAGVIYRVREGCVHIQLEGKKAIEAATTKFQEAYKKLFEHSHRFRVESVKIPAGRRKEEVLAEIARFEQIYLFTAFVLDGEKRVVRVISQTRQFDQAKQFLEEALQQPKVASGHTSTVTGPMVMEISRNRTLTLKKGDIVKENADVLVNAANSNLIHGGGVAGALNAASKKELQKHCDKYMNKRWGREVPVGEVAVTRGGGRLACSYVIHAVGPDGSKLPPAQCEHRLKQVIRNTLKAAADVDAKSVVLPAISCGIFGVSKDLVAKCIIDAIQGFRYTKPPPVLSDIRIVILDGPTHSCFVRHFGVQGSKKHPGLSAAPIHKDQPSNPSRNKEKKTMSLEEVVLCQDDMAWIMPLLKRAAPKWKQILMKIGIPNDYITRLAGRGKEEDVLLDMGVSKWFREQASTGATLAGLVKALCSPEVKEGELASEIMKACSQRKGMPVENSSGDLSSLTYPSFPDPADGATAYPNGARKGSTDKRECPICLEEFLSPVNTECNHTFCKECIEKSLKFDPYCPCCKTPLRAITGTQPAGGSMKYQILRYSVPGYEGCNTIQINYTIPPGVQGPEHPNPGQPYYGTSRTAYLPSNREGWEVFQLLQKAFQARMIFTIGTSVTTGAHNSVVWNDIHHKTIISGGPYGYPDPTYLQRVKDDLAAKGIVPDNSTV